MLRALKFGKLSSLNQNSYHRLDVEASSTGTRSIDACDTALPLRRDQSADSTSKFDYLSMKTLSTSVSFIENDQPMLKIQNFFIPLGDHCKLPFVSQVVFAAANIVFNTVCSTKLESVYIKCQQG